MCGVVGFLKTNGLDAASCETAIRNMADRLVHRGPDDAGVWIDGHAGIALGHCRLSIQDLSPAGHQPMVSRNERYVIVFNGEIYNHLELRKRLDLAGSWRGHSDTETLLSGFMTWGIKKTIEQVVGMFAIAVWDRDEHDLILIRDRIGEKPLYYGWAKDCFYFASELKALKAHPAFGAKISQHALLMYLRYGYVPSPHSIYEDIFKLPPGTLIRIPTRQAESVVRPAPTPYWSLLEVAQAGLANPFSGSDDEAVAELERILSQSVSRQMISDVPIGAFLSGGIDSSTVVALMQANSDLPVKTFSIGFHESGYDEAGYARAVARHLGTDHTELYVSERDAMDVIPRLPDMYDEPFGDSSQIPTFLVSQMARRHVTVSLSGDGGDELFGGYTRYDRVQRDWVKIQRLPKFFREILGDTILTLPLDMGNTILAPFLGGKNRPLPAEQAKMLALLMKAKSPEQFYQTKIAHWKIPEEVLHNKWVSKNKKQNLTEKSFSLVNGELQDRMMFVDTLEYLPGDILVKLDRAAMSVSLETRVPLLDHCVVEFAWSLPLHMKIRAGQRKWLLRQVLNKYVPEKMFDRPKSGFAVPIDRLIRGPLRDWAENLLDEEKIKSDGYFNPKTVRQLWKEYLNGRYLLHGRLWSLLMFQSWLMNNE